VDLALDLGYSDKKTILKINELLSTVPKPDLVFLMDLPEEIAFSRKDDVPSMAFLYEKRKIYKKIGTEFDMVILDGTKAPSELRREIEKEVTKLLTINEVLT
jgi:dTMP kinase